MKIGAPPLAIKDLRENLFALLLNSYTEAQLKGIIELCHAIASASLKQIISDGSIKQGYLGLRRSDIAYDCIADLFRKDDVGNIVQFQTYFKSFPANELSDAELLAHLRRIVQSKTHQGLYRIYQESDPSLGKILRNIKISIQVVRNFQETERFHEVHITPIQCDPLEDRTTIDTEGLVKEFGPMVNGSENIPEMLSKLAVFLRTQTSHRRSVPLMSAALAFRALYARGLQAHSAADPAIEEKLLTDDAQRTVRIACNQIKRKTTQKYLHTKKLNKVIFDSYFKAIENQILEFVIGTDGSDSALFESLKKVIPGLTPSQYQTRHRNTMEYLARLCKKKAVEELQKDK